MDVKTTIISIIASLFAFVICGFIYLRMIKREVPEPIGKLQAILPIVLGGIAVLTNVVVLINVLVRAKKNVEKFSALTIIPKDAQ